MNPSGTATPSRWRRSATAYFTTSGVGGRDPATGPVPRGVPAQSGLILRNLDVLHQVGGSADDLFHITALLGSRHYVPDVRKTRRGDPNFAHFVDGVVIRSAEGKWLGGLSVSVGETHRDDEVARAALMVVLGASRPHS